MPYDDIPTSLPSMLASYLHMDEPSEAQKALGALSLKDVMARPAGSGGQAAAVPPQMAGPRISPGMPAQLDDAPPLATRAQISSDAPVLTDVSPRAQPAPALTAGANTGARPPKPPPVDDLAEAQAEAARQRKLIGVGGLMAHAADVSRGADTSATDKLYAGLAAQADQPVKDLLQKHERLQQLQAEQVQRDLNDPNSDISKRTQLVAAGQGIKGVVGMSAADFQRMQPLIEKGMTAQQAKDTLAAENTRAAASLAGENQRSAATLANQRLLERERMAAERAMKLEDIREKNAAEKQGKPVPEQEAAKIVNQGAALPSIDKLEELHNNVGLSGYIPFVDVGAQGRYADAINALKSSVASGAAPAARENAELMKSFEHGFPKGYHSDDRAKAEFELLRNATKTNMENQVGALKAGGYNPNQIAELQRQGDASAKQNLGAAPTKSVTERIAELKAQGASTKEIKAQLRSEGH